MKYLRAILTLVGIALIGSYLISNSGIASQGAVPSSRVHEVAKPAAIEIPNLQIKTNIIELGLNADQTLEVPSSIQDVGWYAGGPAPGERGPATITAHYGTPERPGIFSQAKNLSQGDEIWITQTNGTKLSFKIYKIEKYQQSEFPTQQVYGMTAAPELRLITCDGDYNRQTGLYSHNLVIYAQI